MGKWTRRAVLTAGVLGGGGLLVGVAVRPGNRALELNDLVSEAGEQLVHAFVKIDADNTITAILPHSEMGQGAHTALAQLLAEELDADWATMRVEEAPAEPAYANFLLGRGYLLKGVALPDVVVPSVDGIMMRVASNMAMQVTGGSMSVRVTGMYGMRMAGAATRDMLRQAAASSWDVPLTEVSTEASHVEHKSTGRRAPYATFAAAAAELTPSYTPELKNPQDFRIVGQHKPRFDIPSKVDGTAQFGLDVRLPEMLYATVQRSPVFGGRVVSVNGRDAARSLPGVVDVIELPAAAVAGMVGNFAAGEAVAVVAEGYWQAQQGLKALDVEWDGRGNEGVSSDGIFAQFDADITAGTERAADREQGDVAGAFAKATKTIEADYRVPYLAHTCMEPLNATARVQDGQCELWVGCQNPLGFRKAVADALDLTMDDVTVHNHFMGGGFGRKAVADYAIQAALLARDVGRPVQLIWSREEDVRQDYYRPAVLSRFKAALDADGQILAWENTYVDKHEPVEAPLIPYAVTAQNIGHVSSPTHVPFGAWRSVDHSQHGFFTESFIDEVAAAAGKDPYEYRAALLAAHPRHLAVLRKTAAAANWERPLPAGRGRGISLQESFGSLVAQVVEVTVADGRPTVDRVVAVIDPGIAIAPDGIAAQLESGIAYGLTAALYGEITIENGAVAQSNFHDYEALRMAEAPKIETYVINSGADVGGAGEPGTPGVGPALANAIYDATGIRVRRLPLNRFDLDFRIEETESV
ncbi:MAG: molybdopterin cofactor-binding domain-containing protein [Pseudomonadota bacterium]